MSRTGSDLTLTDKIFLGLFLLAVFAFLVLAVIGNNYYQRDLDKCSEEIVIGQADHTVSEYLESPWHGGRVYTMYDHCGKYEFEVDGNIYRFSMKYSSRNSANPFPALIRVTYNPDDPSQYFIWPMDESENWTYYSVVFYNTNKAYVGKEL